MLVFIFIAGGFLFWLLSYVLQVARKPCFESVFIVVFKHIFVFRKKFFFKLQVARNQL